MFSIGVVISDDRKIARQPPGGKSEALSGAIGSYGIWHFMDRLMYSWALYDPMADAKSLFPDLPMPQFGSDGTLWKPGNLGDRASPSIDLAVENATNSVIEFVMPCMDEYKNHLHQ